MKIDHFEMDPRTQCPLQSSKEDRVPVEVFPEVWAKFLCMDEPHFPALRYQVRKDAQERPVADIQVLDVRRPNP